MLSLLKATPSSGKKKVAYFYDPDIGSYYYGPGHPMKPQRIRMAHSLILAYELYREMEVYRPHRAIQTELAAFHDGDYVNFLAEISGQNQPKAADYGSQYKRFNVGEATDCPVFDGLFEFQQSCAGASIDAASKLNHGQAQICVNWSGGLHHAKRAEASGFCYINDIVLGILELLKYHARVMYIDIDIHHGDGVEEAFYVTHRVMTVSFHKFGDFFPGTGDVTDVGASNGKYYSVNVPLNDGIDDSSFLFIFKPVIKKCIDIYRPGAIVLQCGADSVTGDRLGRFNLTIKAHAECVKFVKTFDIPLVVLGGGGYTIRNVARAWAYETAVVLDKESGVSNAIPMNDYYEYYGPDFQLHLQPSNMGNMNSLEHLEKLKNRILENLSFLEHAPGVQFAYVPPDFFLNDDDEDDFEQYTLRWEGGGLAPGEAEGRRDALLEREIASSAATSRTPTGAGGSSGSRTAAAGGGTLMTQARRQHLRNANAPTRLRVSTKRQHPLTSREEAPFQLGALSADVQPEAVGADAEMLQANARAPARNSGGGGGDVSNLSSGMIDVVMSTIRDVKGSCPKTAETPTGAAAAAEGSSKPEEDT